MSEITEQQEYLTLPCEIEDKELMIEFIAYLKQNNFKQFNPAPLKFENHGNKLVFRPLPASVHQHGDLIPNISIDIDVDQDQIAGLDFRSTSTKSPNGKIYRNVYTIIKKNDAPIRFLSLRIKSKDAKSSSGVSIPLRAWLHPNLIGFRIDFNNNDEWNFCRSNMAVHQATAISKSPKQSVYSGTQMPNTLKKCCGSLSPPSSEEAAEFMNVDYIDLAKISKNKESKFDISVKSQRAMEKNTSQVIEPESIFTQVMNKLKAEIAEKKRHIGKRPHQTSNSLALIYPCKSGTWLLQYPDRSSNIKNARFDSTHQTLMSAACVRKVLDDAAVATGIHIVEHSIPTKEEFENYIKMKYEKWIQQNKKFKQTHRFE